MKKVLVIGCPGSGKSCFSRRLHEKTGLPLVHLDMLNWNSDATNVERAVFDERLNKALQGEEWIIDGNYGRTMDKRMKKCDTIFFLDLPVDVCLEGINKRKGKPRSDLPWVEPEDSVDEEFVELVKSFENDQRPYVLELLEKYREKHIITFKSHGEADEFIAKI